MGDSLMSETSGITLTMTTTAVSSSPRQSPDTSDCKITKWRDIGPLTQKGVTTTLSEVQSPSAFQLSYPDLLAGQEQMRKQRPMR